MLGDGCIGRGQFFITVNIKTDSLYVSYLQDLLEALFDFRSAKSVPMRCGTTRRRSSSDRQKTWSWCCRCLRRESSGGLRYAHLTKPDVSARSRRASPLDNLRAGRKHRPSVSLSKKSVRLGPHNG